MRKNRRFADFLLPGLMLPLSFWVSDARAWGRTGHELVAEVGSELAAVSSFFANNESAMSTLTNTPDNVWKAGPHGDEERTQHWFEPDSYFDNEADFPTFPRQFTAAQRRFGDSTLNTNGTAPWRILQSYDQGVDALRAKNWVKALQMAGVMSHYVGDLSQPLHVTENFDGQRTRQSGIHSFFESANLNRYPKADLKTQVKEQAQALLRNPAFLKDFDGKVVDIAFQEILRSYPGASVVLDNDKRLGRNAEASRVQIALAITRMADGAATLALVLDRMWKDSNMPQAPNAGVSVPVPEFLVPRFYDEGTRHRSRLRAIASTLSEDSLDDCQAP